MKHKFLYFFGVLIVLVAILVGSLSLSAGLGGVTMLNEKWKEMQQDAWRNFLKNFDWNKFDWKNFPFEDYADFPWDQLPWDSIPEDFDYGQLPWDQLPEDFPWDNIPWENLPEDFDWGSVPWDELPAEEWEKIPWEEVPWDELPEDFPWDNVPWDKIPEEAWDSMPWEDMPLEKLPENFPWDKVPFDKLPEDAWGSIPWDALPDEVFETMPWDKVPFDQLGEDFPWDKVPWDSLPDEAFETMPWENIPFDKLPDDFPWDKVPWDSLPDEVFESVPWEDVPLDKLPADFPWDKLPWDQLPEDFPYDKLPWETFDENFPWDKLPWDSLPDDFPWWLLPFAVIPPDQLAKLPWDKIPWEDIPSEDSPHKEHNPGSFPQWEVLEEPTCGTPGRRQTHCVECGQMYAELIPPTNAHEWDADGICSVCHKLRLILKSPDKEKEYDGSPLSGEPEDKRFERLEGSAELPFSIKFSVSYFTVLTHLGETKNIFYGIQIFRVEGDETMEDVTSLFYVEKVYGTLRMTKRELTVTTDSVSKKFDGQPLSAPNYTAEGLAEGDRIVIDEGAVWAEQTGYGRTDNVMPGFKILDKDGNDVTNNYVITLNFGKLEITR